jgi:hypothetical protein
MNPADKTPDQLTHTLQRQADRFAASGGASLDLEQVVSRAGEIRRGRRMRASMVMAAVVLAVAVPIGVTALGADSTKPKEPTPATKPDNSDIGLGDLKTGKEPKSGYLDGKTLITPDGTKIQLGDIGEPSEIARLSGGFLVSTFDPDNGKMTARFLGDDGVSSPQTWPVEGGFAVSKEGNVGAFVQPNGTVIAVQDAGSRPTELGKLPAGGTYSAAAVDGENCSGRSEETGCTVYADDNSSTPGVWAITPHTAAEPAFPKFRKLNDISVDGSAAGLVSASDDGSCSEVRDVEDVQLFETCDYSLTSFSPDGKYVLAGPAYLDGPGDGQLAVLDANTGHVVLELGTAENGLVQQLIWEDDTHLLTTVYEAGQWAVERIEINGYREYATKKAADVDDSYSSPFRLG